MTHLNYRTPQRSVTTTSFSEFATPLALLVTGLLLFGLGAFWQSNVRTAGQVMAFVFVVALVQTVLGIGAAYVTAAVIGTSFGELRTAVVKLAGIIVFSGAIAFLIPFGGLLSLFVYFGLLLWLFGLEMHEAIVFAIIFGVIRFVAMMAVVGMLT